MSKVSFYLKNPSAKETSIYASFSYHSNRVKYYISQRIETRLWDKKRQRIKSRKGLERFAREFNMLLDNISNFILTKQRQLINDQSILTIKEFKSELDIFLFKKEPEQREEFLAFAKRFHIARLKDPRFAKGSNKKLKTVYNILVDYAEKYGSFTYEDIDPNWSVKFTTYLFEEKQLSINYTHKILSIVRQFMYAAQDEELHSENNFKSKRFMISRAPTDGVYLSLEELQQIYHALMPSQKEERIRDLFLIANFLGVRWGDWHKMNPGDFFFENGIEMIKIMTGKTKEFVAIPINPVIKKIAEKYDYNLPPIPSDQYFNREIKTVCKIAGINQLVWKNVTNGGQVKQIQVEKYTRISTHTARRSFATNAYLAGISPLAISKLTGHKQIKQLLEYIKASPVETAISVADNDFFKGEGF